MKKIMCIKWILSLVVMGGMGLTAELAGIQEIIFPETAALLTGCFLMPGRPWNVPHGIFTMEMGLSALAGILVSRHMQLPLYFKVLTAVIVVFIFLVASRTSLLPAISACALPVLIGTTDWIYVVAVLVIAAVCDLGNAVLERYGMMEVCVYKREKRNYLHWGCMLLVFALVLLLPMMTGLKFMVAPPLIVAFVSLCGPGNLKKNRPAGTVILFTGTACIGFFCSILSKGSILPQTVCIMIAAAGAWLLFSVMKRYFPPAAAIGVLPFLLPSEDLWKYPLEIMAGILFLYFAAWVVTIYETNRENRDRIGDTDGEF